MHISLNFNKSILINVWLNWILKFLFYFNKFVNRHIVKFKFSFVSKNVQISIINTPFWDADMKLLFFHKLTNRVIAKRWTCKSQVRNRAVATDLFLVWFRGSCILYPIWHETLWQRRDVIETLYLSQMNDCFESFDFSFDSYFIATLK